MQLHGSRSCTKSTLHPFLFYSVGLWLWDLAVCCPDCWIFSLILTDDAVRSSLLAPSVTLGRTKRELSVTIYILTVLFTESCGFKMDPHTAGCFLMNRPADRRRQQQFHTTSVTLSPLFSVSVCLISLSSPPLPPPPPLLRPRSQ